MVLVTTPPPVPSQLSARTGTKVHQAAHGFTRGQPVYWDPTARLWKLATTATGWTAVVGSISDVNRFEAVTSGELDNLPQLVGLADPNVTLYLSGTPGTYATSGTVPVLQVKNTTNAWLQTPMTAAQVAAEAATAAAIAAGVTAAQVQVLIDAAFAALYAATNPLAQYLLIANATSAFYVIAPENGGVLDIDSGSLVFDVDAITQVLWK